MPQHTLVGAKLTLDPHQMVSLASDSSLRACDLSHEQQGNGTRGFTSQSTPQGPEGSIPRLAFLSGGKITIRRIPRKAAAAKHILMISGTTE